MKKTMIQMSVVFLLLVSATIVSLYFGRQGNLTGTGAILLFGLLVFKGQQIVDHFMGLKKAPLRWRIFLLSYIILIPVLVALILYAGTTGNI